MKKRAFQIGVAAVLVALAFVLRGRQDLPETPEATVSAFFDAAGRGDEDAYLRLVTGELRKSLTQTRAQMGSEAFRKDLVRSAANIKGLAVTRSENAPAGSVAIDVELVFADRNERQRMILQQDGGGWVITSIEPAVGVNPPIPYGTPVFQEQEAEQGRDGV